MTVKDFCQHYNNDILPFISSPPGFPRKVCLETARKFLHDLGFERVDCGKKGCILTGMNDRMLSMKKRFLKQLEELESAHLPPSPPLDIAPSDLSLPLIGNYVSTKYLVVICHDQSSFQSNEDQRYSWLQADLQQIRPKSRGSGRMISDFIDEFSGYITV